MKSNLKILTILGAIVGISVSGYGVWLWASRDFPINELIPYKNTFATNPIHISYIGIVIFIGSIIHGVLKYGWLNSKS